MNASFDLAPACLMPIMSYALFRISSPTARTDYHEFASSTSSLALLTSRRCVLLPLPSAASLEGCSLAAAFTHSRPS